MQELQRLLLKLRGERSLREVAELAYEKLLKAAGYLQTLSDNSKEECDPDIIAIQTAIRKANSQQRKKILELLKATFFELFEDEGY